MAAAFARVVVPIEIEPATPGELALDRAIEVGDHQWVAVNECTIHALQLAARLAQGGALWIVHATPDFMGYATWMPPAQIAQLDGAARGWSVNVLAGLAGQHCPGVTLHYVIAPGSALALILATARSHAADAIVLAASARHRVNRALLGSTADKVIRQSTCPVIVVPSGTA